MTTFVATVFDGSGTEQIVRLKGSSEESVRHYLHQQGYTIQALEVFQEKNLWQSIKSIEFGQRLTDEQSIRFIKTMGQMMKKGYALEKVIDFLIADERQKQVLLLLRRLQSKAQQGYRDYEELFRVVEESFDPEFFSLLVAGQKTGTVGQNMIDYARGKAQMLEQKRALLKMLSGKCVLFVIVLLAFIVVVVFVVPQFQDLFGEHLELPIGMKVMVWISDLARHYGLWLVFGFGGLGTAIVLFYRMHQELRFWIQHTLLKLPVLGGLLRMMHTRNFLYLLGHLLEKGVSLMEAMTIVVNQTQHLCFRSVYVALQENLKKGRKLEQMLKPLEERTLEDHFTPIPEGYLLESVAQAMTLGSKGGNLGEMLTEAYQSYDIQLQSRISLSIRVLGFVLSAFTYLVMIFMIGSLAMTLFRVMEDPTAFVAVLFSHFSFYV